MPRRPSPIVVHAGRILAALLLAACGSSTEPTEHVSVTITATKTAPGHLFLINGSQFYACDYRIDVLANSFARSTDVVWAGGRIDYRLTSTGQVASTFMSEGEEQEWFGSDKVSPGASLSTTQRFAWTGPFTATLVLSYQIQASAVSSESRSVTVPLECN